ncbi:MAG: tRNA (pseudouridine(54)-N(1))-methyltransferase TrmY [Byssovorax sp.]
MPNLPEPASDSDDRGEALCRRRFVILGQKATASPDFSLINLPASSGRLDVLLRCLRAGLMVSHGLRRDTVVYLVLLGGPRAPRTIRVDGATARYLRPDERALAVLVQKVLAAPVASAEGAFVEVRPGVAIAEGGLDAVLADLGTATLYVLEEGALDAREAPLDGASCAVLLGDHLGFDETTRARLAALGATPIGVGPVSVHADDAVVLIVNELDRRATISRPR